MYLSSNGLVSESNSEKAMEIGHLNDLLSKEQEKTQLLQQEIDLLKNSIAEQMTDLKNNNSSLDSKYTELLKLICHDF